MTTQRLYKLTDADGYSYNRTHWEVGVTHTITKPGNRLCTDEVLHACRDPLVAIMLNLLHTNIERPRLWLIEGDVVSDDWLKVGSKWQTVLAELDVPAPTTECRVAFAILCALEVYEESRFVEWARGWLSGADRSRKAARAAANAAAAVAAHAARGASYNARASGKSINLPELADRAFHIAADGIKQGWISRGNRDNATLI